MTFMISEGGWWVRMYDGIDGSLVAAVFRFSVANLEFEETHSPVASMDNGFL